MMDDLLLTFYGDDFTGSTDVLESLSLNGVSTVLFLEEPTSEDIERFEGVQALGIAGTSRSMTPEEMDDALPSVFNILEKFNSNIIQYKVCSTFDSSPSIGSIGRAIDLGQDTFESPFIPVIVSTPSLEPRGRYVLFGNLFATVEETTHRLDRHPTMSQHPVTPMTEADLTRHLGEQTDREIGLLDVRSVDKKAGETLWTDLEAVIKENEIVIFDALNSNHQLKIGRLIWEYSEKYGGEDPLFSASSSGLNYALSSYWRSAGIVEDPDLPISAGPADQILVMSGSASPVNRKQIDWALENGFDGIRLDSPCLVDPDEATKARKEAIDAALAVLKDGGNPLLYSVRGPNDSAINRTNKRLDELGIEKSRLGSLLGKELGKITRAILNEVAVNRICIAGGDTSGHVAPYLDIFALEFIVPVGPGSPLCRAASRESRFDGLEIALKGGQVQTTHKEVDYFGIVRDGGIPS